MLLGNQANLHSSKYRHLPCVTRIPVIVSLCDLLNFYVNIGLPLLRVAS